MSRITLENAINALKDKNQAFTELFKHGSMNVEFYKPNKVDLQSPHTRDEIYVIISGSGWFLKGNEKQAFEAHEIIFVPAGLEHRFIDFTDDFSTWVIFYGPEGGEVCQNSNKN